MINKLVDKIKKTNAPIVVGLDPMLSYVPEHITKKAFDELGETPAGAAEAIWQYNKAIVDATYDLIPAVKPQIAMYEQFGVEGLKAFQKTVDYCHEKDLVVIGDVKRGDIGSTSAASPQDISERYRSAARAILPLMRICHCQSIPWNRRYQAIRRCMQGGEEGYLHSCKDI